MTGGIFRVGNRVFAGGTHIMGILNVTPDSFYAGSRVSADEIARRALEMVRAGAEVLDIGGESTRPGAAETDAEGVISVTLPQEGNAAFYRFLSPEAEAETPTDSEP